MRVTCVCSIGKYFVFNCEKICNECIKFALKLFLFIADFHEFHALFQNSYFKLFIFQKEYYVKINILTEFTPLSLKEFFRRNKLHAAAISHFKRISMWLMFTAFLNEFKIQKLYFWKIRQPFLIWTASNAGNFYRKRCRWSQKW